MELIYILVYYCLLALLFPSEILKLTVREVAVKLGFVKSGFLVVGGLAGVICLGLSLAAIIYEHRKLFTPHLEVLKTELRKVKTDYEVMKADNAEKVTKRMAGTD